MSVQGPSAAPQRFPELRPARPAPAAPAATAPAAREASLWEALTDEERAFFDQQAALGPLTYGKPRSPASAPAAPTGQRLDVRA